MNNRKQEIEARLGAATGNSALFPNPNRFIKSSFALSLLWTARFYCALEAELEAFSSDAEQCAHAALSMFDALSQFFEKDSFFEDVLPVTANWLCFSA